MLLEKVRNFGFAKTVTQTKHAHKFENGLGPKVPAWLAKELVKMAEAFDCLDSTGTPMSYSTVDLLPQNPAYANACVAAYLDKKSCRQVISQIALLGRLRAVFSKNPKEEIDEKMVKAIQNSKRLEDVWEKRPSWWDVSTHDLLILQRLHQHGFSNNVLSNTSGFGFTGEVRLWGISRFLLLQEKIDHFFNLFERRAANLCASLA